MTTPLPVTLLSGFLGSGKTSVLTNLINSLESLRLAIIVNDMSELNIDASLLKAGARQLSQTEERLVEMQNGCICCTLREDLLLEVGRLAREGKFDYLLIESSGISEPMAVAETFAFDGEEGTTLQDIARLDTMVTVVDIPNFLSTIGSQESLKDRKMEATDEDERGIMELLVDQIEFANVILLNKTDLVTPLELFMAEALIRKINPKARLHKTIHGRIAPDQLLDTGLFDMEAAMDAPGWMAELRGEETPETEEYGISSMVFRARRPFHPKRLNKFINKEMGGIVRSKGFVWIATRHDQCGAWSQAGEFLNLEQMGMWSAAALEPGETPDEETLNEWEEPWGDRRQELVFIGVNLDKPALEKKLNAALMKDKEMKGGPEAWEMLEDPLPEWEDLFDEFGLNELEDDDL
ncbi:MAG: GTP-binding protein [Candidatus Sumerlaeia bacterium]|nr:GTP-binding protein [Candidatus Sumerlaeia bacterium]